jgi:GntR family transcriptional regulator
MVGSFDTLFVGSQVDHVEVLSFDFRQMSPEVAELLHQPVGTRVRYIERVLSASGAPIAHVRNFVPLPIGDGLTRSDFKSRMLQEFLASRHDTRLVEVQDDIDATLADYNFSRLLMLPLGRPLLSLRRVFLGARRRPLNVTFLLIASDRYKMKLNLRQSAR